MEMPALHMSPLLFVIVAVCSSRRIGTSSLEDTWSAPDHMEDTWPAPDHMFSSAGATIDPHSYCNHHKSVRGSEGTVMTGYSLEQIHIVLSPGHSDISSKVKVHGHTFPPMSCDTSLELSSTVKEFKEMSDIFKEVNRNLHFQHFHPTFPKLCSNHHLTSLGFEQVISVGRHLNSAYFSHRTHKKLKPKYSSIHIESVSKQKAYHSVLGFLQGFLNENQLFKTKIHQISKNFCEFVEANLTSCKCSKTQQLAPYLSQALARGSFMFKKSFPNTDKITNVFQTEIHDDTSGVELFHTLTQYKCDNGTTPCAENARCHVFEEDRLAQLHDIVADYLHSLKSDSIFRTYSELMVYPLLEKVLSRARRQIEHQSISVYMGDGQFVQFLATTLGIFRKQITPLASRLVLEIYKKKSGQIEEGLLYVKVHYNGDEVTDEVSGCTFHMENGLCKMGGLKLLVDALRTQYLQQC